MTKSKADAPSVMIVAGARPNFVKICPILWALESRSSSVTLVHTGQHYDSRMSTVFFDDLGLRAPDISLNVRSGSHAQQTSAVMLAFEPVVESFRPDVVVVVGDVNSTLACGIVTAKAGTHLAHVEAGLRSRDWNMPEEINRVLTDRLSDLLFAPSADACDNLRAEGYRDDQIVLVGNVMVDTLLVNLQRARARPVIDQLMLSRQNYALVTLHRPSNVDDPVAFSKIIRALRELAKEIDVVFPVHPRTRLLLDQTDTGAIRLLEPCGYLDFIALQDGAAVVLTDSGGVQEETTMLGVPCLTLRQNTERPITVTHGSNRVIGTDPERIVYEARAAIGSPRDFPTPEFWDGRAGERIADALLSREFLFRGRPTEKSFTVQ